MRSVIIRLFQLTLVSFALAYFTIAKDAAFKGDYSFSPIIRNNLVEDRGYCPDTNNRYPGWFPPIRTQNDRYCDASYQGSGEYTSCPDYVKGEIVRDCIFPQAHNVVKYEHSGSPYSQGEIIFSTKANSRYNYLYINHNLKPGETCRSTMFRLKIKVHSVSLLPEDLPLLTLKMFYYGKKTSGGWEWTGEDTPQKITVCYGDLKKRNPAYQDFSVSPVNSLDDDYHWLSFGGISSGDLQYYQVEDQGIINSTDYSELRPNISLCSPQLPVMMMDYKYSIYIDSLEVWEEVLP